MLIGMDTVRFGLQMRALRMRRSLRQSDLAPLAKLSRTKISRIERGQIAGMPVSDLERAATALGAAIDLRLRWRGEQLDRLLDESHARLVDVVVALLRATGWEVAVEVSYSISGERGSIDVLAYHRLTGIVLVVEVKSVVPDSQAMLHALDRKTRLARQIAMDRGWACRHVARLLVIGASPTARRRIHRLASTYDTAFPARGQAVRGWLSGPKDSLSGLLFVSYAHGSRTRAPGFGRQRVRRLRNPVKSTT
jgi:transcriptional regulator with XRE-family HTH domain